MRAKRVEDKIPVNPFTAGVYCATMMAQIDILLENGPPVLGDRQRVGDRVGRLAEPVHARARRRLHGRQLLDHGAPRRAQVGAALRLPADAAWPYVAIDEGKAGDAALIAAFKSNLIHDVLAVCAELRPSVDISVS